jgi:hypothetical protein
LFYSLILFFKGIIRDCSPQIAALDYNSLNSTIDIKCTFKERIDDPLDLTWKFGPEKNERMAVDMDGVILAPFQHQLVHLNESPEPYTVSVLKIKLVNASYYTNYTIMSISGNCQQIVRIHLKERGICCFILNNVVCFLMINFHFKILALGYTNEAINTISFINLPFFIVLNLILYLNGQLMIS